MDTPAARPLLNPRPTADVQAALTVLARRDPRADGGTPLDLTGTDLRGAQLAGAPLTEARFREANLAYANLEGAAMAGADFTFARLDRARLNGADLRETTFWETSAVQSDLAKSDLRRAYFYVGDLRGAQLWEADVEKAKMQIVSLHNAALKTIRNWRQLRPLTGGYDRSTVWPDELDPDDDQYMLVEADERWPAPGPRCGLPGADYLD